VVRRGHCFQPFMRWIWQALSFHVLPLLLSARYYVKVENTYGGVADLQFQQELASISSIQPRFSSNCAICTITCISAHLTGYQRSVPATWHQQHTDCL
jgi:hypothetical protein